MKKKEILVITGIMAAAMLSGCGAAKETETESETVKIQETETETETEEAAPDYSGLVDSVLDEDIMYENYKCVYQIPEINLEGDEIEALNQEIYDKYSAYYEAAKADCQDGWYECCEVHYHWGVADNKLSLTIESYLYPDSSGWIEPEVFTVDLSDNSVMDQDELEDYFDLEEDYDDIVRTAIGSTFLNYYSSQNMDELLDDDFNYGQFTRTIADENVEACKLYMTEEGHPGIYATIYSLAGGDHYPALVDLADYEDNDLYETYAGNAVRYQGSSEDKNVYSAASEEEISSEEETSDEPEDNAEAESDYILPESSDRYLSETDISGMSSDEIQMAVNEIYARHGRIFRDENVKAYFESKSWYEGTVSPDDFSDAVFNDYEKTNIKFLLAHK